MMPILRAIDHLVWDDQFEQFRHLAAWLVVIAAAIYFLCRFANALTAAR